MNHRLWLVSVLCLLAYLAIIKVSFAEGSLTPLPVDQAFGFHAAITPKNNLHLQWHIEKDYFLYRDRIALQVIKPFSQSISLPLPRGTIKQDEILGTYEVYKDLLDIHLPISQLPAGEITLVINYQGCAASGFCYPPAHKQIRLISSPNGYNSRLQETSVKPDDTPLTAQLTTHLSRALTQPSYIEKLFGAHSATFMLLAFFCFGLLLSFTPCVLPMIPILSSLLVGQANKKNTKYHSFILSLSYVLSMSFVYALLGMLAAHVGEHLQASLQTPLALGITSFLFFALAASLFGWFELISASFQSRFHALTQPRFFQRGSIGNAIFMGIFSSLIVSPCVTAPLIGALAYIAQTGDRTLGGLTLLMMGLGMGTPLLVLGTLGPALLPSRGPWMEMIKRLFGLLLLAVAIHLLTRVLPERITYWAWILFCLISASALGLWDTSTHTLSLKLQRVIAIILFLIAGYITISVFFPQAPLRLSPLPPQPLVQKTDFNRVTTLQELYRLKQRAKALNKPVIVDFYADWCVACKIMERTTFQAPPVINTLAHFVVIQADVTNNDMSAKELLHELHVIAPPTFILYDTTGKEIADSRIVGEINATGFIRHLQKYYPNLW